MSVAHEGSRPHVRRGRRAWRGRAVVTAVVVVTCASGLAAPTPALAAPPTWEDVLAAQGDAAATEAQVERVTSALDDLEATAADRGQEAVDATTAADAAAAGLATAEAASTRLTGDAALAADRATAARQQAGQLAGQIVRGGGQGSLTVGLLASPDADATLWRLGALTQLGERTRTVLEDAEQQTRTAESLRDQADLATAARDRVAAEAQATADAATTAAADADAEVEAVRTRGADLYAQLATLKGTSAEVEQQYRQGVAAQQAYAQQAEAAARAVGGATTPAPPVASGGGGAGSGGSGGGSGGGGTVAPPRPVAPPVVAPPVVSPPVVAPPPVVTPPPSVVNDPAGAKAYARSALAARGQGEDQYTCLVQLWNRESGWRTGAENPSSGAYGIPQALPGTKMASAGADWRTNPRTQVDWGLGYIAGRYGTACAAWDHSNRKGWY